MLSAKVIVPPHMSACLDAQCENYVVEVELPGVKKTAVNLTMHEDIIHVTADRDDVAFHGHLHFPLKVKPKQATATFNNGLLRVEVPLKEKRQPPVTIKIK